MSDRSRFLKDLKKSAAVTVAVTMAATTPGCTLGSNVLQNPNPIMQEQQIDGEGYFAKLDGVKDKNKMIKISKNKSVSEEVIAYVNGENVVIVNEAIVDIEKTKDLKFRGIKTLPISLDYKISERTNLKKVNRENETVDVDQGTPIKIYPHLGGASPYGVIYDYGLVNIENEDVVVEVPRGVEKKPLNGEKKAQPTEFSSDDVFIGYIKGGTTFKCNYSGVTKTLNGDEAYFLIKNKTENGIEYKLIGPDGSEIKIEKGDIMSIITLEEAAKDAMEYNAER